LASFFVFLSRVKIMENETLIAFGDSVKALGDGKVGGYLVRYSGDGDPDLTADYFDAKTAIHSPDILPVLYQHGFDAQIGKRVIGKAKTGRDDVGMWIEAQLNMRDEYEKAVYELAEKGKLGWSSGALSHLVEREPTGKSTHITTWFIGEASLTPTPAEPRNTVMPIKSLVTTPEAAMTDNGETKGEQNIAAQTAKEKTEMNEELKAAFGDFKTELVNELKSEAKTAAKEAVTEVLDGLPEVKALMNGEVKVEKAAEDQPFTTKGEFFMAVKNAALRPSEIDPRLKSLKATGMNEAIPSQGGFLVPPQVASGIIEKMYNTGTLLGLVNRDPVTGNSMAYNIVDEDSRADGSRNGGIVGYWGAEGGTKTASKPTFRQLELKLKKVYALCVATDELLEDAPALESWLSRTVPNELRFKVEDAIINGDGVGKPLGILNSGAIKSVTRTDANEIDALDLGRMWASRYAGANDYVWLGNQAIFPQILNMSIGNVPMFLAAGGLSGLPYSTILGRPYYDIEYLPALGSVGDLLLFSPSQYQMIEKAGGIQSASSIHVYFTTDETAFRFVYRVDGAPTWDTTLTLKDGTTTVSPIVALAATT
jgi:HK97 family phage major capsid protein